MSRHKVPKSHITDLHHQGSNVRPDIFSYPSSPYRHLSSSSSYRVLMMLLALIFSDDFQKMSFFTIFFVNIWNQHDKWIKIGTNMPMFGQVVLEMACSIFTFLRSKLEVIYPSHPRRHLSQQDVCYYLKQHVSSLTRGN